ncbi:syntaxin-binding protein 5-like isoform X1 [Clavelina lepadiformis]|uniref:syntaxin-binding protein 5-like isoform X1 n=1 Tax=Clavelina lepadiformis TaxID=159417 RepID=UPI004041DDAA
MKKVNLKRVLGFTNSSPPGPAGSCSVPGGGSASTGGGKEVDFGENLSAEQFQTCKIVRHGFPHRPTAIAYDSVQKLLAIGNYSGSIRIFGQPGVDCHVTHDTESPVILLMFLANQGALVSLCADNTIHLWNLRQKKPAILHSLKFNKERITCCYIPHQCSWIYLGTEHANTYLCNVETFTLSGYSISWNKVIGLSQSMRPGFVVSIRENPVDQNKVLIAFELGIAVLWDLKSRSPEHRYYCKSNIHDVVWHFEGKQFMCSHKDGSLTLWNVRNSSKPVQIQFPHAKTDTDTCYPIDKVDWKACRNGDPFIIFSGGVSESAAPPPRPSVTIMRGRSVTVLEMDFPIVDLVTLSSTPWTCDFQDPTALVILLDKELVVLDLEAPGYPCIELGHVLDIHDSPVTCLKYVPDANTDLTPGLYQVVATKTHRVESSNKEWPIAGGEWSVDDCDGIPEIIVTGHADGSVRFWDASAVSLKSLYKLRTYKIFKKDADDGENEEEDPFHITHIFLCPESRTLVTTNVSSTVTVFKLSTQETKAEITCLTINHADETFSSMDSLVAESNSDLLRLNSIHGDSREEMNLHNPDADPNKKPTQVDSHDHNEIQNSVKEETGNPSGRIVSPLLRVKSGLLRQSAGFHAELTCLLLGNELDPPPNVTFVAVNTSYQILSFGTTSSLCVVDLVQKTCLLNMSTDSILTSIDKKIQPRSPNKLKPDMQQGSFSFDQTTSKSPTDENPEINLKGTERKRKQSATTRRTRLTRKSIGDYFSMQNSTVRLRRSSVFAKAPTSSPTLSLASNCPRSLSEKSPDGNSPPPTIGEEEISPNSNDEAFEPDSARPARVRFLLGAEETLAKAEEKKTILKSDACNGSQSHPPLSIHYSSGGKSSREPSVSSVGSQRNKKPQHRSYKKAGSFTFEKSVDSTTSADDCAFSRASSFSDVDRSFPREMVTFLTFANTYTRKSDNNSCPCLWVGSSSGYLFSIVLNLPPSDHRISQPVMVSPSGSLFQVKGSVVSCSFLDSSGHLMSAGAGNWRDQATFGDGGSAQRCESPDTGKEKLNLVDKQFMVISSEKQVKVLTLPSQVCIHSLTLPQDNGCVMKSNVDISSHGACLACFSSSGNISVYRLPSLNILLDASYLPANDVRITQTFCFSLDGQAIYLASPSEIQRITYSLETFENIQEVIGHVFIPCQSPEKPQPGFLKGLFGGGFASIDRQELFGDAQNGRPSRGFASHIPGTGGLSLEGLRATSSGLASDMQRLQMVTQERGEKLSELEDRSQRMQESAGKFSSEAHALMLKYKNKKWYQM